MSENEIHRIVIENSNETHEDKETEGLCNVICILYVFILLINFITISGLITLLFSLILRC